MKPSKRQCRLAAKAIDVLEKAKKDDILKSMILKYIDGCKIQEQQIRINPKDLNPQELMEDLQFSIEYMQLIDNMRAYIKRKYNLDSSSCHSKGNILMIDLCDYYEQQNLL